MRRIITIAVREFVETVKTKAFFFGAILMPMLIIALVFGVRRLNELTEDERIPTRRVAVVDHTGRVLPSLREDIERFNAENPGRPFAVEPVPPAEADLADLRRRVREGQLYAYLVVPPDAIDRGTACEIGRKDNRFEVLRQFREMINEAVVAARFQDADPPLDLARVRQLEQRVELNSVDVTSGRATGGGEMAQLLTPFAFLFLLFSGTFGISQGLLTSLIEEKGSRVIEVLLSAVSPLQLMAGKILGTVAVGGLLLAIWGSVGYSTARAQGMAYLVTTERLVYVGLYFVPSFLFFASLLGAVGSACNTLKEAQSMSFPLSIVTIVPMMLWFPLSQNPHSALAIALSFVPPVTPFVMILRVCADPDVPVWQVAATLGLLWASVFATIWMAAKIFRVGVLMYGKPPTLRELARWVRSA